MKSQRRIVNAAIDYDSCGHNSKAKIMVLWLIATWGDVIVNFFDKMDPQTRKIIIEDIAAQLVIFNNTPDGKDVVEDKYCQKLYKFIERQRANGTEGSDQAFSVFFNDCYNQAFIKHIPQILNKIFVLANQNAIDHILEKVKPGDILFITSFSNRVNKKYDDFGIYERCSNSCFNDFVYFTEHMRSLLKDKGIEVCLNPITRTDIEAGLPVGESFRHIVVANEDVYPDAIYDQHKVSLLFTVLLNLTARFPEDDVLHLVFDDADQIIRNLKAAHNACSSFFTKKTELELIPYVGEVNAIFNLCGTADKPELNYRELINYLIRLASYAKSNDQHSTEAKHVIDIATSVDFKEVVAMRAMRDESKRHDVKISAEQLYHPNLRKLLIYVADQFGAAILDYHAAPMHVPNPVEKIMAAAKSVEIDKIDETIYEKMHYEVKDILIHADHWLLALDNNFIAHFMLQANEDYFRALQAEASAKQCVGINLIPVKQAKNMDQFVLHLHDLVRYLNLRADFELPFVLDRLFDFHEEQHNSVHEPVIVESGDIKVQAFNNLVAPPAKVTFSKSAGLHAANNAKENDTSNSAAKIKSLN